MLHARAGCGERMLLGDQSFVAAVGNVYNVLFLCTGNSARSIMAECALNRWGEGKFRGFSAGSHPKGVVHPMALEVLRELNHDTAGLCSKSWDEFASPDAPRVDFIITVCDNAAAEVCPIWPGHPVAAHWGVADPAAFVGSEDEKRNEFWRAYRALEDRIRLFVNLNLEGLDKVSLRQRIEEIGASK